MFAPVCVCALVTVGPRRPAATATGAPQRRARRSERTIKAPNAASALEEVDPAELQPPPPFRLEPSLTGPRGETTQAPVDGSQTGASAGQLSLLCARGKAVLYWVSALASLRSETQSLSASRSIQLPNLSPSGSLDVSDLSE